MGIADLFRPKHRHSDAKVRSEAVRSLTQDDAALLVQIARTDRDSGVRRLAIERIGTADVLAEIAAAEPERPLRDLAGARAAQLWLSHACGSDAQAAGAALAGMIKLGDQKALVEVIVRAEVAAIRKRAFGELRDPKALAELAKSAAPQELRTAAVAQIDDGDILRALAIDTTQKEVGLAAVDKLDDVERLDQVAQKAKAKAVRQRARKIVAEIEEAERAKKPTTPDDIKRRRAEKAQLLREVDTVVDSFDFARSAEIVKAAEAAWAKLGGVEDDDRFTKTVERFWKRKEIHDQQARTADELRSVEREAVAERDRSAAERAARVAAMLEAAAASGGEPAATEAGAAPGEPDPKREAREAEAKARREERDRLRVEDEARKQAQAAERAARQKEDAERGAAIAASLTALCVDMEGLAAQTAPEGRVDNRAIDRLLNQAGKAFEQIGKVLGAERDAIADRYRAARGKLATRAGELREAEDWQRWTNVPKAEALIATAKQMFEAPATPDLGNRLRGLQALWKEVGPMPQRRSKELWEQFKAACDQVYDKVRGVRAVEQEKFAEVIKIKEALIAEAEGVADSTDWAATAELLKGLQARWKDSGHLPRKQGDELWKRFRAACDRFFERRKPELDARHAEEEQNLADKRALIARVDAVVAAAPADGNWGKSIGEIKDLQRAWKEIGYVPRRDADAVYKAFRVACDGLFAKRDAARDEEANAHRAEIDAVRAEIEAVRAGGDDVVNRAIAARAKARELGVLAAEVEAMVAHVIAEHAEAIRGSELDPAQLRSRREKLIARAVELLPKAAAAPEGVDLAAQLKNAMRHNAFGALRFSGRDPVEVIDELRAHWAESGPWLDDEDRAQQARFDETVQRVLDAAGVRAKPPRPERPERPERDDGDDRGRRRRRDRRDEPRQAGAVIEAAVPVAVAEAAVVIAAPHTIHDAITRPVAVPAPEESIAPAEAAVDEGWDLGDDDPTASSGEAKPEISTPSSTEMAGDGAVDGDGHDAGWD